MIAVVMLLSFRLMAVEILSIVVSMGMKVLVLMLVILLVSVGSNKNKNLKKKRLNLLIYLNKLILPSELTTKDINI